MTLPPLPHSLERSVLIRARRDTVFRYFTDRERWAAWWGAGSSIDPHPGGRVFVRYPNGIEAAGEVLVIEPPARIVFSFGYLSGTPVPVGASRVTIQLEESPGGTRLHLRHDFAESGARDHHVQGWRYQLAVFANVVGDHLLASAGAAVDAWYAAWSEPDGSRRGALLDGVVAGDVRFRDRFSLVEGRGDLDPHLAAVHVFMPGSRLARTGEIRRCQDTVLADWIGHRADGTEMGRGTNVFRFDPDGRIAEVVGVWGPAGG